MKNIPEIRVLGIRIHVISVPQLHGEIERLVQEHAHSLILNVNTHAINLALQHHWLAELYEGAGLVFCDGAGVILGARILGNSIPDRITYADWIWELAEFAEQARLSLYMLGSHLGVSEQAAAIIQARFPRLRILGHHHGYFDKSSASAENEGVLRSINRCRPNILIVGMGMPTQERWLAQNWGRVEADVALTGGAVFDYVTGSLRRPPKAMTDHGWEWLGRLLIEPRRLWRRYLVGNPLFLARVLMSRLGWVHYE